MALQTFVTREDLNRITLGAIYNLSGGQSRLDVPSARGAQLAVDEVNERGGIMGRPVELVVVDGATDPAVLVDQTSTMLLDHPTTSVLFGLSDTDMVLAAASTCAAAGRLFVTSGATSPQLPDQVPAYLYLACFGDNVQAAAAAEYAYETLEAYTAAVFYRREDTFTELLQEYFITRFSRLGGRMVSRQSYATLAELNQAVAGVAPADLVFFSAAPDDVIEGIDRIRAGGITAPILGGDSFDLGVAWTANPALSDVYLTTHGLISPANPDPAIATFIDAYERANPGHEAGTFAALGYDTTRLILAAITAAGSSDPAAVLEALPTLRDFHGLTGSIRYDNGRRVPTKTVTLLKIDHGEVLLAGQFMPAVIPQP